MKPKASKPLSNPITRKPSWKKAWTPTASITCKRNWKLTTFIPRPISNVSPKSFTTPTNPKKNTNPSWTSPYTALCKQKKTTGKISAPYYKNTSAYTAISPRSSPLKTSPLKNSTPKPETSTGNSPNAKAISHTKSRTRSILILSGYRKPLKAN